MRIYVYSTPLGQIVCDWPFGKREKYVGLSGVTLTLKGVIVDECGMFNVSEKPTKNEVVSAFNAYYTGRKEGNFNYNI